MESDPSIIMLIVPFSSRESDFLVNDGFCVSLQEQMFSETDSFYAWTFERRRPLWQTVLSFLVPVVTLACCLFPVFPHWCKLGVLYTCLAFLTLIFGVLICKLSNPWISAVVVPFFHGIFGNVDEDLRWLVCVQ